MSRNRSKSQSGYTQMLQASIAGSRMATAPTPMTHSSAGLDKEGTGHVPHDSGRPTVRRTRDVRIGPERASRATAARAVPDSNHAQPNRQARPSAGIAPSTSESDLSGTHGVIVGIANERSLACTIAQAMDAEAARFLLGPGGRGVTGEVLVVDGGFHSTGM